MHELDSDNLKEVLDKNEKVFVQFGAGWCGNCRLIKPKIKKLSEERDSVVFYYVDAEKYPESRKLANVANLPAYATYAKGELVKEGFGTNMDTIKEMADEIASH